MCEWPLQKMLDGSGLIDPGQGGTSCGVLTSSGFVGSQIRERNGSPGSGNSGKYKTLPRARVPVGDHASVDSAVYRVEQALILVANVAEEKFPLPWMWYSDGHGCSLCRASRDGARVNHR